MNSAEIHRCMDLQTLLHYLITYTTDTNLRLRDWLKWKEPSDWLQIIPG